MFSRTVKIMMLVVIAIGLIGCSATPTRRSFKEGWKDSIVSTKVKFKLMGDKLVKKRNLDVDVWRGVVTMTGHVISMDEKERAEQLAWQVKGVRGVDNFIKLVDDAYYTPQPEVVAEETLTEKDVITVDNKTGKETEKIVVKEKVVVKRRPTHPMKTRRAKVSNRVEGPVVYQSKETVEYRSKRGSFERPISTQIQGQDLTSEERLAQEAAEELRKLRGEDIPE